jgi:hypothetical protein
MKAESEKTYPLANMGITSNNIISLSSAIHSDANANNNIEVDYFDRTSDNGNGRVPYFGRGGTMYASSKDLILNIGPKERPDFPGENNHRFNTTAYDGTANRGWVKICYLGTKSTMPSPYVVKTKTASLGGWNMTLSNQTYGANDYQIPFNVFGIKAAQIMSYQTVIQSDDLGWGTQYSNLYRNATPGGATLGGNRYHGGGGTSIDEQNDRIYMYTKTSAYFDLEILHSNTSRNRGYVSIDYMAGSCENGLSGFMIQAIPGTKNNLCGTATGDAVFQGSGKDFSGFTGNKDDFVFAYKPKAKSTTTRDLYVQVKSQTQNQDPAALAGIMIRETLDPGSRFAAIHITPGNGIFLTYRGITSGSKSEMGSNGFKAPYYIRLKRAGDVFTAYYRSPSTTNWTTLGSVTISQFATSAADYYYGLSQSSGYSPINSATISNKTGF